MLITLHRRIILSMRRWSVVIGAVLILSALLTLQASVKAQSSGWFDTSQELELTLVKQNTQKPYTNYWGLPCTDVLNGVFVSGIEQKDCVYYTGYGYITKSAELKLAGVNARYPLFRNNQKITDFAVPIPSTNNVLLFNSYAHIYNDLPASITPVYSTILGFSKLNNYKFSYDYFVPENRVVYQDGTNLREMKQNGFSFSNDGNFIALNAGRYQALVNTKTRIARKFGANSIPFGTSSNLTTSLNSDGSVVLTSDSFFNDRHTLYNLNNCTIPIEGSPEQCQKRDLTQLFRAAVPSYEKVSLARFASDSSIEVYFTIKNQDGSTRTDEYLLKIPGTGTAGMEYLALGDSYASGEGAYNYKPITDISTNKCHISYNSYPYLITSVLGYGKGESIACSGAMIKDVVKLSAKEYSQDDPQGKGKDDPFYDEEIYKNFLPGYRRQHKFIEDKKPAVITLSIGGNDINFGKKLRYCILTQYSCFEDQSSKQGVWQEIKNQFDRLFQTYDGIKKANPDTNIYVIGYPNIVKPGGNCAVNVRLSNQELQIAEDIEHDLNETIRLAAKRAGVFYVDTTNAFDGFRLCEDESWKLAVNGVTAGNDKLWVIGNETYHPNKLGHILYKKVILEQTANLTKPMPEADSSITIDDLESRLVPAGTNIIQNLPTPILTDGLFGDMVQAGSSVFKTLTSNAQFFKPGSTFKVEVHSTPIEIGTATATSMTELSFNATLPNDLEPGAHSIHILGTNINNEPIDLYQNIFVIANQNDYDGDGTTNSVDNCQFIQPVGIDGDRDGIDDGCDDFIAQPTDVKVTAPAANLKLAAANVGAQLADTQFSKINNSNLNYAFLQNGTNINGLFQKSDQSTVQDEKNTYSHASHKQSAQSTSYFVLGVVVAGVFFILLIFLIFSVLI